MPCAASSPDSCISLECCWRHRRRHVEFLLRDHFGYPWALTMFEGSAIGVMIVIFWFGAEARDRSFLREATGSAVAVPVE
jgi:hypothetical protein